MNQNVGDNEAVYERDFNDGLFIDTQVSLRPWIADARDRPGSAAYEVLAFMARANSMAFDDQTIGRQAVPWFDVNVDMWTYMSLYSDLYPIQGLDGNPLRWGRLHSYQFYFDAGRTYHFYKRLDEAIEST